MQAFYIARDIHRVLHGQVSTCTGSPQLTYTALWHPPQLTYLQLTTVGRTRPQDKATGQGHRRHIDPACAFREGCHKTTRSIPSHKTTRSIPSHPSPLTLSLTLNPNPNPNPEPDPNPGHEPAPWPWLATPSLSSPLVAGLLLPDPLWRACASLTPCRGPAPVHGGTVCRASPMQIRGRGQSCTGHQG